AGAPRTLEAERGPLRVVVGISGRRDAGRGDGAVLQGRGEEVRHGLVGLGRSVRCARPACFFGLVEVWALIQGVVVPHGVGIAAAAEGGQQEGGYAAKHGNTAKHGKVIARGTRRWEADLYRAAGRLRRFFAIFLPLPFFGLGAFFAPLFGFAFRGLAAFFSGRDGAAGGRFAVCFRAGRLPFAGSLGVAAGIPAGVWASASAVSARAV